MTSNTFLDPSSRSETLGLSGARAIFENASRIPDAIHFELGEPDFDTPENIKSAAIRAIMEGKTKYSSSAGIPELKEAISRKFKKINNIEYDRKEVVITTGATGGLSVTLLATMDPGQEILVPDPGWATCLHSVMIAGVKPIPYGLSEDLGYSFAKEELEKLLTSKTRAILINSPHNPTGAVLSRRSIEEIADFSIEHNLAVFSDEVYERFLYNDEDKNGHVSIASLNGMKQRVVTINSFSKTYSMTGWRIGYVGAPESVAYAMTKVNAATSSCISTISQYAALEALQGPQESVTKMISAFRKRRDSIVKGLNEVRGFSCPTPNGAFYAFPNIEGTGLKSEELATNIINESRVAVVPGSAFGEKGENHLRLAYSNSLENIHEALSRIKRIM